LESVRRDAAAIEWVFDRLLLIDQVGDGGRVKLGCTEDERLLALVDPLYQHGNTFFFPFFDLNDAIKVRLGIAAALLDFTFYDVVVRRVDVVVKRCGDNHANNQSSNQPIKVPSDKRQIRSPGLWVNNVKVRRPQQTIQG